VDFISCCGDVSKNYRSALREAATLRESYLRCVRGVLPLDRC